ncbi:MAG: AAA family ATPase, partial [Planctomycetota bacterium]
MPEPRIIPGAARGRAASAQREADQLACDLIGAVADRGERIGRLSALLKGRREAGADAAEGADMRSTWRKLAEQAERELSERGVLTRLAPARLLAVLLAVAIGAAAAAPAAGMCTGHAAEPRPFSSKPASAPERMPALALTRSAAAGRACAIMTAIQTPTFEEAFTRAAEANRVHDTLRLIPAEAEPATVSPGATDAVDASTIHEAGRPGFDEAAALAAIRAHLAHWGIPLERISRLLKINHSVVDLLLANPARVPDEPRRKLLRDIAAWCAADAHERELKKARFIPTAVTKLVNGFGRLIAETRTAGLLLGGAGLGKSFALQLLAADLPAVYVRADPDARGARGLLRAIAAAGATGPAAVCPSVKAAVDAVRRSAGLCIVDEGQLLSTSALTAAQAVFDGAECGLLLCGTTALNRQASAEGDPLCGPLATRIAARCDVDATLLTSAPDGRPRAWLQAAELRAILARHGLGEPAADATARL